MNLVRKINDSSTARSPLSSRGMPSELRTLYSCEGNTRKNALAARVARGIPIKKCGIVSNNYPTKIREEPEREACAGLPMARLASLAINPKIQYFIP